MSCYSVETSRFGVLLVDRETIADARRWAREAHGVTNPSATRLHREPGKLCGSCDSKPCCCEVQS